jgi:hypothetical protein
VQQSVLKNLR